jgi:type I restriction enzyme, S subunit
MEKQTNIPPLRFPKFKGEWEEKKLGKVAEFSKGKGISKADIIENGETECIRYGELYTVYGETISEIKSKTNIDLKYLVLSEANDVIIPASGETQIDIATASCVMKSGIALGGDLNIIKTKNNGVFLSYFLNSAKKQEIANLAQGISVVHLYSSQLATLNISFPTLPEQTKIATFLTAIDQKIQTLKKKKSLLENYKKGVMQKLFLNYDENDLMNTMIADNKNHSQSNNQKNHSSRLRFKDKDGKNFADWEVRKLGEVGEIVTGKTPSTTNLDLWDGNIQFVTPTDIDENKYQFKTQRTIKELEKTKILPANSIMFTCIASIGKMSLSVGPCVTNQQINSIIPFDKFENEFIYYSLLNIVEYIKSTQSTNTLPIINKTEFSKFEINVPINKKEQTLIANFLSAIDEKINKTNTQITQTETWKKGLLQKMFI